MAAKKVSELGKVFISASFNNTLVTVTNEKGEALAWGSSGTAGFKGTRKATPYAATLAVEKVIKKAKDDFGVAEVEIYVKGPGPGRDAALRALLRIFLWLQVLFSARDTSFLLGFRPIRGL